MSVTGFSGYVIHLITVRAGIKHVTVNFSPSQTGQPEHTVATQFLAMVYRLEVQ